MKFKDNYVECAKCITHEHRHIFKLFYVELFDDDNAKLWKQELENAINSSNASLGGSSYYNQDIEKDAFTFTEMYLEMYEGIKV